MKQLLFVFSLCLISSAFSQTERVSAQVSEMSMSYFDDRVEVAYPSLGGLQREGGGDVIYAGSRMSGRRLCKKLGLGQYVRGTKKVIQARVVSTNNLFFNKFGYAIAPMRRLEAGYQYPRTKIISRIQCFEK